MPRGQVANHRDGGYGYRPAAGPGSRPTAGEPLTMHYPRRVSKIKRVRKLGFRARMRTRAGRKLINRKRREGRRVS